MKILIVIALILLLVSITGCTSPYTPYTGDIEKKVDSELNTVCGYPNQVLPEGFTCNTTTPLPVNITPTSTEKQLLK
jgi:hypothetical protein